MRSLLRTKLTCRAAGRVVDEFVQVRSIWIRCTLTRWGRLVSSARQAFCPIRWAKYLPLCIVIGLKSLNYAFLWYTLSVTKLRRLVTFSRSWRRTLFFGNLIGRQIRDFRSEANFCYRFLKNEVGREPHQERVHLHDSKKEGKKNKACWTSFHGFHLK